MRRERGTPFPNRTRASELAREPEPTPEIFQLTEDDKALALAELSLVQRKIEDVPSSERVGHWSKAALWLHLLDNDAVPKLEAFSAMHQYLFDSASADSNEINVRIYASVAVRLLTSDGKREPLKQFRLMSDFASRLRSEKKIYPNQALMEPMTVLLLLGLPQGPNDKVRKFLETFLEDEKKFLRPDSLNLHDAIHLLSVAALQRLLHPSQPIELSSEATETISLVLQNERKIDKIESYVHLLALHAIATAKRIYFDATGAPILVPPDSSNQIQVSASLPPRNSI